jgi:hypothetical protein
VVEPAPLKVVDNACEPLPWKQWKRESALVVHEATTCSYKVRWTWWNPPRDYDFQPDEAGWIQAHFISSGNRHGRVFWNLRTNEVWVRPIEGNPLGEAGAREVAAHAKNTIFPGMEMSTVRFNPTHCAAWPCAPDSGYDPPAE